jgi:hypothetical protein
MASLGYLLAAGGVTLAGLVGYAIWLVRRLREARIQRDELQEPH